MDSGFLIKEDVVKNLWDEYSKTADYRVNKNTKAISKENPIIITREEMGLREVFRTIENELANCHRLYSKSLQERTASEWINEWITWHKTLFKYVLKKKGKYREIDVWFGNWEDQDLYQIPKHNQVREKVAQLADDVRYFLNRKELTIDQQIEEMAIIHYRFIAIHPFQDGNGRIGRLLIDQIALSHNLPMAMGGYPRNNKIQRQRYHAAITACTKDNHCVELKEWIREKIYAKLDKIS
jgi:fido (protein-threonine AMPylation protein)